MPHPTYFIKFYRNGLHINIFRHNEDGSYTYGYEGADGSFKIETKLPTGEVKGKYGYVDDTGKLRVVEYGATKHGFQPSGEGITVAPPTLVDESTHKDGSLNSQYSGAYYDEEEPQAPLRTSPRPRPRPQPSYESYSGPQQFSPAPHRAAAPVPPRAVVPGVAPITTHNFEFGTEQRPIPRSFTPAPARHAPVSYATPSEDEYSEVQAPIRNPPRITYAQASPLPQRPQPQYSPEPRPVPQYAPRPVSTPSGRSSGGILDQLSKDYALPQGGAAPLHDISFGYY